MTLVKQGKNLLVKYLHMQNLNPHIQLSAKHCWIFKFVNYAYQKLAILMSQFEYTSMFKELGKTPRQQPQNEY